MKTLFAIVMTVVLTAALLTGCGCTNRNIETTTEPTVLPTNEEIWNSTETTAPIATTTEPTMNTTHETRDNSTTSTENSGNTTDSSPTDDNMASRARRMMPDLR